MSVPDMGAELIPHPMATLCLARSILLEPSWYDEGRVLDACETVIRESRSHAEVTAAAALRASIAAAAARELDALGAEPLPAQCAAPLRCGRALIFTSFLTAAAALLDALLRLF